MDAQVPLYGFQNQELKMNSHRMMAPLPGPGQNMAYYGNGVTYTTALQSPYALHPMLSHQPQYHQGGFFPSVTPHMQRLSPQHTHVSLPQEHHQLPVQAHHHVPDTRFDKTAVPNLITTPPPEPMPQAAMCTMAGPQEPTTATTTTAAAATVTTTTTGTTTAATAAPVLRPEVTFSTEVDTLMKAIQAKPTLSEAEETQMIALQNMGNDSQTWPQSVYASPPGDADRAIAQPNSKSRRKYQCTLPGCGKAFYQKTHLDIHMRAHTGDKPFLCKEPGCGQRFSQLGNLKTHQRRHTGEKPFPCDICHKRFAQRGNVRAHRITHQRAKPYICRLDDCGKPFTQLGNLKSHQNKFHAQTLRELTMKFANITDTQHMSPQDKALWQYFAGLYKNSNKGIKGRGKDRRVSTVRRCCTSSSSSMSVASAEDDVHAQNELYMNATQSRR